MIARHLVNFYSFPSVSTLFEDFFKVAMKCQLILLFLQCCQIWTPHTSKSQNKTQSTFPNPNMIMPDEECLSGARSRNCSSVPLFFDNLALALNLIACTRCQTSMAYANWDLNRLLLGSVTFTLPARHFWRLRVGTACLLAPARKSETFKRARRIAGKCHNFNLPGIIKLFVFSLWFPGSFDLT